MDWLGVALALSTASFAALWLYERHLRIVADRNENFIYGQLRQMNEKVAQDRACSGCPCYESKTDRCHTNGTATPLSNMEFCPKELW